MPNIAILTFDQTPDSEPEHYISKAWAAKFLSYIVDRKPAVVEIRKGLLWIRANITFSKLKALFRPTLGPKPIPRINPPRRPEGLLLYYPHKDQGTLQYQV